MTSEYDELLARLDGESADYRGDWSSVSEAAAAIRALTAQVAERDAAIEQAPHVDCDFGDYRHVYDPPCTCWKSQAPRDALAARDAVRDKTVRATALREAAEWLDENADRGHVPGNPFDEKDRGQNIPTWIRARADQEEPTTTNGETTDRLPDDP